LKCTTNFLDPTTTTPTTCSLPPPVAVEERREQRKPRQLERRGKEKKLVSVWSGALGRIRVLPEFDGFVVLQGC